VVLVGSKDVDSGVPPYPEVTEFCRRHICVRQAPAICATRVAAWARMMMEVGSLEYRSLSCSQCVYNAD